MAHKVEENKYKAIVKCRNKEIELNSLINSQVGKNDLSYEKNKKM